MSWRHVVAAAACLLAPVALAAGAAAGPHAASCDRDVECREVKVPLDRSGRMPGTLTLHVEVLRAEGAERGVMLMLAGGPGQGSAEAFDLGSSDSADYFRSIAPGYTFVAFDNRGTGRSGPLRCPMVTPGFPDDPQRLAACARLLGAKRDFYGTADHAQDVEAVRAALGYESVAVYGVSYGSQLALAYALARPNRVDRLLLDSVVPVDGDDPFLSNLLSRMTRTLARYCAAGACRGITSDFAGDIAAVANSLAAKPLQVKVPKPNGRTRMVKLDGLRFLSLVFDADLNPGLAAELPAVARAFRAGDRRPLRRVFALVAGRADELFGGLNVAMYVSTICRDGPFPWPAGTPVGKRSGSVKKARAALPAGALGPFGRWAADAGTAVACLGWPAPKGGTSLGVGPLPNVPMLALSGDLDLRTPTADAAALAARFPQGHLLVVPGIGHSVLSSDLSTCTDSTVRAWLAGRPVRKRCPRQPAFVAPVAPFGAPGTPAPQRAATPQQTMAIVSRTFREAKAMWFLASSLTTRTLTVPGLLGGKLVAAPESFELTHYSLEPGVTLSGRFRLEDYGPPLSFGGVIEVAGAAAAPGTLAVLDTGLRGTLGGKLVSG